MSEQQPIAERLGPDAPKPDYVSPCGTVVLWCADCLDVLKTLPDGCVDAVVTDPPYGIDACRMTLGTGQRDFHRGDWDRKAPRLDAVLRGSAHCVWGGNYFTDQLPPTNDWLVWHKKNDGLSFSECEMAWTNYGCNVRHLSHHWSSETKQHPTMKPLSVMLWAIGKAPGSPDVCDPFLGSGTTGVAAVRLERQFLGVEIDPDYFAIAVKRIEAELNRFPLFENE